jgi:hypothetical protein
LPVFIFTIVMICETLSRFDMCKAWLPTFVKYWYFTVKSDNTFLLCINCSIFFFLFCVDIYHYSQVSVTWFSGVIFSVAIVFCISYVCHISNMYDLCGPRGNKFEVYCLLGHDAVEFGRSILVSENVQVGTKLPASQKIPVFVEYMICMLRLTFIVIYCVCMFLISTLKFHQFCWYKVLDISCNVVLKSHMYMFIMLYFIATYCIHCLEIAVPGYLSSCSYFVFKICEFLWSLLLYLFFLCFLY